MHGVMTLTCSVQLLVARACHCANTRQLLQDIRVVRVLSASPHTIGEAGGTRNTKIRCTSGESPTSVYVLSPVNNESLECTGLQVTPSK